jgi:uncharacterized membrane protein HdeD (DUF308 family)
MSAGMQSGWVPVGNEEVKRSWGWFVALGAALVVLGLVALGMSVATTIVSVTIFGWLLLFSGVLSAGHAFWRRQWAGFFIELFAGILYIIVGLMVLAHPLGAAEALTLLIALFLMVGGVMRIVAGLMVRFHHSVWVVVNGIISLLLGVMIWRQWPVSGLWVIGMFIGIDLIFYGWSLVMLGLVAKKLPGTAG